MKENAGSTGSLTPARRPERATSGADVPVHRANRERVDAQRPTLTSAATPIEDAPRVFPNPHYDVVSRQPAGKLCANTPRTCVFRVFALWGQMGRFKFGRAARASGLSSIRWARMALYQNKKQQKNESSLVRRESRYLAGSSTCRVSVSGRKL